MQAPLQLVKASGPAVPNSYIIKLKEHITKSTHHDLLRSEKPSVLSSIQLEFSPEIFNGYSAEISEDALNFLLHCDHVEAIEENVYFPAPNDLVGSSTVTEHENNKVDHQVNDDTGAGVDVYVLDTGIYTRHSCFQGRARFGKNFTNESDEDINGHGTFVASIAVGYGYGQATNANVISVKVIAAENNQLDWLMGGFDWAYQQSKSSGRPSVANMSGVGPRSDSFDSAVRKVIAAGLSVIIAAGNYNQDTSNFSPAAVMQANVVGAVDNSNAKWSDSNYGASLKVWAPGVDIRGAWIGGPNYSQVMSGTSAAAPLVSAYLAIALGRQYIVPPNLTAELEQHAKAVVTGQLQGTTNLLAQPW